MLPREVLITIYEAFVRTHLDYGDVLFDQAFNASFHEKSESIQYNASLALTGINTHYSLRASDNIPCFNTKHNFFKNSFLSIEYNRMEQIRHQSVNKRKLQRLQKGNSKIHTTFF